MTEGAATPDPLVEPSPVGASVWNIANLLTGVRLLMVPLFAWLLLRHPDQNLHSRMLATMVFVVAAVTDRLDGQLARSRNLVTDLGKIADPIADKALTGTALVALAMLQELSWWVVAVIVAREVAITVLRLVVIRRGVIPAGRGGKLKTVVQIVAVTMYLVPWGGFWHTAAQLMMAIAVVVTVLTGMDYLVKAWRLVRR